MYNAWVSCSCLCFVVRLGSVKSWVKRGLPITISDMECFSFLPTLSGSRLNLSSTYDYGGPITDLMPKHWQIRLKWLDFDLSFLKWVFIIGPPILKSNMGKRGPALDSGEGPGTAGDVPDEGRLIGGVHWSVKWYFDLNSVSGHKIRTTSGRRWIFLPMSLPMTVWRFVINSPSLEARLDL